ncbi:CID2A protein, partial [Polyodon spathula]|nr:CID2A protein [Polyodon spathula]
KMVYESIAMIIKKQLPAYLKRLPLPESITGFAKLTVSEWLHLLPLLGVLALLGYLTVRPFLPKKKQQKDSLINLKIQKENPKVVNEIDIEDLKSTNVCYCRCWRSKTLYFHISHIFCVSLPLSAFKITLTDYEARYVLNILLAPLVKDGTGKVSSYLAKTHFMQKAKSEHCLKHYKTAYNNVVVFDTDNAYTKKKPYKNTMCYMAGGRKMRYLITGRQKVPSATMALDPVATRWNSWFVAVQYHANHFQYYHGFVEEEMINAVANIANAEHSNSLYNLVLSDRRRSLSED